MEKPWLLSDCEYMIIDVGCVEGTLIASREVLLLNSLVIKPESTEMLLTEVS